MNTKRFGSALALSVLGLSLSGGGVALAATTDAPVAGTAACTNLVNVQGDVITARATLQADINTLNADLRATPVVDATVAADRARVTQDQAHLNVVVDNVTASLCIGTATVTPAPTTTPVDPAPVPFVPNARPTVPVAVIDGEIDALSCSSSRGAVLRVFREIARDQVAHVAGIDEAVTRVNTKLDNLDCTSGALAPKVVAKDAHDCGATGVVVTPAPTTVVPAPVVEAPVTVTTLTPQARYSSETVIPTASDGTQATVSGSQVTDVPTGSASTGAA